MGKRLLFSFLWVCFSISLLAQGDGIIDLSDIPKEGILLNSGWKYKLGDNPDWAKEEYSDHDWKPIDPTPDIHELPILWKDPIVWFRLYLRADSTSIGDVAMTVLQAGASEIFLNGRLIRRFGVVSQIPDEIVAYNPRAIPVALPLNKSGVQVLTVRYSLEPKIHYSTEWANQNPGLYVTINSFENAHAVYQNTIVYNENSLIFRISAYVILAILYLSFYVSNRRQKTSLYFFVYALIWAVVWTMFLYMHTVLPELRYYFYKANLSLIVQVAGEFVWLTAIYRLLGQNKKGILYSLILLGLISIPCGIFIYGWGWQVFATLFITLVDIAIVHIAIGAVRKRRKGARIILTGAILCLIFWVLFIVSAYTSLYVNIWLLFSLNHLSIPVAVSIYIGYDFALTNRSLEQKLVEVRTLSDEKNRILSIHNETLERSVSERTVELQQSLSDLKSTQSQLIQSEKMASLGELTAGIAHEIQNPLNFVNNFSDLNTELLNELQQELKAGKSDEALSISNDIKENESKINHHGKRADAIVKGMLQHSRSSGGVKEPTDINALCEEYLRLSYHGLRAKDKTFNAKLETDFDPSLEKINVVPQDIGRVVLNLINNAFYAVAEKKKQMWEKSNTDGQSFEPRVSISTRKIGENNVVSVKDNGEGIPAKVLEKIFQPFFTTKPSGQGTGLGLSLSYDIVRAHGGELKVETKEGEGSEFIVVLPV